MSTVPASNLNPAAVIRFRDVAAMRARLPRLLIGLVLLGSGIACTLRAKLGVSPYDVLHQGIANTPA